MPITIVGLRSSRQAALGGTYYIKNLSSTLKSDVRGKKDPGNMHLQFLLHVAAVLQLLPAVFASVLPLHPFSSSHQPPLTHGISFVERSIPHSVSAPDLIVRRSLAQMLRDHRNLFEHVMDWGRGYTCIFNTLDFFAPNYATPAQEMSRFYSLALSAAGYEWGNGSPSNVWQYTWGAITLTMRSTQPIPFRFIRGFLTDMVRLIYPFYLQLSRRLFRIWKYLTYQPNITTDDPVPDEHRSRRPRPSELQVTIRPSDGHRRYSC